MECGLRHAPAALPPRKDPVPIVEVAGWAPGPVWTGVVSNMHGKSLQGASSSSRYNSGAGIITGGIIVQKTSIIMSDLYQGYLQLCTWNKPCLYGT
jgi:hypothetical protein